MDTDYNPMCDVLALIHQAKLKREKSTILIVDNRFIRTLPKQIRKKGWLARVFKRSPNEIFVKGYTKNKNIEYRYDIAFLTNNKNIEPVVRA